MTGPLSLDTEFIRERTYYPQLCLLQISDATTAVCVDCLAGLDLTERRERLLEHAPVLMHSGRQDLEILWQQLGQLPTTLIDTQIAAGLLGMAPQIGYGELVENRLSVKLDKSNSRRDWTLRPLPADALRYALDDVHYLRPLWDEHVRQAGIGGISEIFDATAPQHPNGCITQAWSVSELLRVHKNLMQHLQP